MKYLNLSCEMIIRMTSKNRLYFVPPLVKCSALLLLLSGIEVSADSLLIRNATLLDMTSSGQSENANILIRDNIIERIWNGDSTESLPADTRIIDATGKYVMPSLIDSHVHYNWYMGELFLAHGITTVADLGARIHWQTAVRKGLNSGKLRGPRFLFCARIGSDPEQVPHTHFASVSRPEQAKAAVAIIKDNADCVRQEMTTPEPIFTAITAAARAAGLGVIAHSYDAMHSVAMGVTGIEHLEGVAIATIRSREGRQAVQDMQLEEGHKNPLLYQWMEPAHYDDVISALVNNNVYLNPTLIHEWTGVTNRTAEFEQDDLRLFNNIALQYIPMDEKLVSHGQYHWADQALFTSDEDIDVDQKIFVNNSYYLPARGLRHSLASGYSNIQDFLRRFVAAGGKLFSGTDTAASSTPGLSLHHEMQLLVDAGISEYDTLLSSTRWAAEILRIDDRLGTVEPGKLADLLILGADPMEDIANISMIQQVIMAGKVVDTTYNTDYQFPFRQYGPVSKHLYHKPPVITRVEPGIAVRGSQARLRISGREFMPDSVATFNGETVTTEYLGKTELSIVLSTRQTANPGSYLIGVQTPAPGGGMADPVEFIVDFTD
jgi:imidazolonepropionase-like amidohydrolase